MSLVNSSSRRRFLQGASSLLFGLGMTSPVNAQDYEPSVTFNDQNSSGDEVIIAEIQTDEAVSWKVHGNGTNYARGYFGGQQRFENKSIELEKEIKFSQKLYFSIYPEDGGYSLAHDSAMITVENNSIVGVNEIEKNPEAGFHFPYFLYVPPTEGKWNSNKPLLVHQNNSPHTKDDFAYHKKHAKSKLESPSRQVSDELGIPLLVPIIPRPHENRDANRLQAMGNEAIKLDEEQFERIDLQVINMIEHAQEKLGENSHPVRDKVILNGYSGSGQFAQRFSMLHPKKVLSVSAGGMAGTPTLPLKEAKDNTLNYYLGIADFEDIIGETANLEAIKEVDKFYYEGGKDANDFLLPDNPNRPEMRTKALEIFGEDIVNDRIPFAKQAFEEAGVSIKYRIYEDQSHEWAPVEDLIAFHEPHVPENEEIDSNTTTETDRPTNQTNRETTSETDQSANETTRETTASSTRSQTTSSTAPGLGALSGLASILGVSYISSKFQKSSDN